MPACRFRFDVPGSPEDIVAGIGARVREIGGSFEATDSGGNFVLRTRIGRFKGRYTIDGNTIVMEVTKKPFLVPCSAIRAKLVELAGRDG